MKPDIKKAFPKPPTATVVANKIAAQFARSLTTNLPKVVKHLPEPPFFLQKKIGDRLLQNLMAEQIALGEFDFLQDKWLKLSVNDMGLVFFLTFLDGKLQLSRQMTQADVSFSGDSKEYILLASRREDPDTLFFQRRLIIEGDTELGLYIKNSIDGIDFDNWPAWLNQSIQRIASFVAQNEEEISENSNSSPAQKIH